MAAFSIPSPAAWILFLLAVALLGALCTLSVFLAVARTRPHLLPQSLRPDAPAERRALKRTARRVRKEVDLARRMKDALLNNVSHEMRTPLTGIMAAAQILRDEVGTEQRELTDIILRDSQRMHSTLSSVLDLVELESTPLDVHPQRFDIAGALAEAVSPYAGYATKKGIALRVEPPPPDAFVVTDPVLFRKVVGNLVDNAIKFTDRGHVCVTMEPDADWIRIAVQDTGPGIARSALPTLFAPFSQGEVGLTRTHGGTGIGLTLTRKMVDLMGGRIVIHSEPGQGSTFMVALPVRRDAESE